MCTEFIPLKIRMCANCFKEKASVLWGQYKPGNWMRSWVPVIFSRTVLCGKSLGLIAYVNITKYLFPIK